MKRPPRWKVFGVLVLLIGGGVLVTPPVLRAVGRFLVVADRLEPSDAIVVMSGEVPFRQMEAARLFHRGLAPRVVLTRESERAARRKLRELGLAPPDRRELASVVLQRFNVPPGAIEFLSDAARDTAEELAAIHRFALKEGLRRVIIVSSPDHMRRIRLIWRRGVGPAVDSRLHPAPEEGGFNPDHWWTSKTGVKYLVHEYFGMLNFLLGSPLRSG